MKEDREVPDQRTFFQSLLSPLGQEIKHSLKEYKNMITVVHLVIEGSHTQSKNKNLTPTGYLNTSTPINNLTKVEKIHNS